MSNWTIGAQLSTSHSASDGLALEGVVAALHGVKALLDLQILVVGAREIPDIFLGLTAAGRRPADQVFLWYNILSDIADMEESDLVVNWRGDRSRGWGGWAEKGAEVDETFRFACPNNPAVRTKTLGRLRELLSRYAFDGVFLDKMRFPSPANGLGEVASCFCEHCQRAAAKEGLDLDTVAKLFAQGFGAAYAAAPSPPRAGSMEWLAVLAGPVPLLSRFLRFRSDSITRLIADAHGEASRLGRKVSLDLFSPGLAPLVGQDYAALARYAAWAKPMTYRVAKGPAGLRLEIPALVEDAARMFAIDEASIVAWASRHVPGFDPDTLEQTRSSAVPVKLMIAEITAAVRAMPTIPVYFGLELVSHPGVIEITPALVEDMVGAGREGNAAGAIISWDLMHAPADGLSALAASV
jgi:hypothetical protein